ncbi:MAG: beta-galactosidase trimerization domain-containing protein [Bacteroidota bacterium]
MIYIGAEIFIEPGQTAAEINGWFETMSRHGMKLTRIRMFENYMHKDGVWDFSLFDIAFIAAEKHGVLIYANLFPDTGFDDVGGFKFCRDDAHLASVANYIKHLVIHFSDFSSLYGWVPINEPGLGAMPDDELAANHFKLWKSELAANEYTSNGFTTFDLAEERFLLHYNTWFLKWLTEEIRKYDPIRPIHVNNHDIFKHAAEYDFPAWREFLSSLGGSAHASWHFDYFNREQYAVGMSANAEMLRSGAGDLPWFMTELQGGNNTYSGKTPLCPTAAEIAQWLWINIGSGSKGGMFWCLNPRRSGFEAGEWGMLDYLDEPTDRVQMAGAISAAIDRHERLVDDAVVLDSGLSVIYTRESLWIEKLLQIKSSHFEGRAVGGIMKSALAYFEALSEMGVHAAFQEIGEYDFSLANYTGKAIILAHQVSIPSKYWNLLSEFIYKGGKLIVDGLTAYYDENAYLIQGAQFPLRECFGAVVREFKLVNDVYKVGFTDPLLSVDAHLWKGILKLDTAVSVAREKDETLACRNTYGAGSVLWMPSLIGLGGRITYYSGLCKLLSSELYGIIAELPVKFSRRQPGMLMKVLKNEGHFITVMVNKSGADVRLELDVPTLKLAQVVFSSIDPTGKRSEAIEPFTNRGTVMVAAEETLVLKWVRL